MLVQEILPVLFNSACPLPKVIYLVVELLPSKLGLDDHHLIYVRGGLVLDRGVLEVDVEDLLLALYQLFILVFAFFEEVAPSEQSLLLKIDKELPRPSPLFLQAPSDIRNRKLYFHEADTAGQELLDLSELSVDDVEEICNLGLSLLRTKRAQRLSDESEMLLRTFW